MPLTRTNPVVSASDIALAENNYLLGNASGIGVATATGAKGRSILAFADDAAMQAEVVARIAGSTIAPAQVTTPIVQSSTSAGGTLKSNSGATCLTWGAGGGANLTTADGLIVTGALSAASLSLTADLPITEGGTGSSTASGARTNLGLGTAATLDVAAAGNAAVGEVVKGDDTRLTDSRTPSGGAGGVLSGTYPNPGFAVDMATQAELDAHTGLTSGAHGISVFGASLVDDADASTARTTLGLGTISTQNANAVAITGGAINGTSVGATTPSTGAFTTLSATSAIIGTDPGGGETVRCTGGYRYTATSYIQAPSGRSLPDGLLRVASYSTTGNFVTGALFGGRYFDGTNNWDSDMYLYHTGDAYSYLGWVGRAAGFYGNNPIHFHADSNNPIRFIAGGAVRLEAFQSGIKTYGQFWLPSAYTAGAPTATGYVVLYDSTGTAYKIPAEAL